MRIELLYRIMRAGMQKAGRLLQPPMHVQGEVRRHLSKSILSYHMGSVGSKGNSNFPKAVQRSRKDISELTLDYWRISGG